MKQALLAALGLTACVTVHHPPPSNATIGTVHAVRLPSPALGVTKRFLIYLPPSYASAASRRFPVMYLLHGYGDTEADWLARGDLDAVVDSLSASGVPEMIVVMPDGDNGFWTDWAARPDAAACAIDTTLAESRTSFCVNSANYGRYLAHELVGYVDSHYRTLSARAHRGVAGLSMGGMGALTQGLTYPDVFAAVVSLSPPAAPLRPRIASGDTAAAPVATYAEWELVRGRPLNAAWRARWSEDTATWWRQDPERAGLRLIETRAVAPAIRLVVGTSDLYFAENRALHAALLRIGVHHEYIERPGRHDWVFWRRVAPEAFAWLARAISP